MNDALATLFAPNLTTLCRFEPEPWLAARYAELAAVPDLSAVEAVGFILRHYTPQPAFRSVALALWQIDGRTTPNYIIRTWALDNYSALEDCAFLVVERVQEYLSRFRRFERMLSAPAHSHSVQEMGLALAYLVTERESLACILGVYAYCTPELAVLCCGALIETDQRAISMSLYPIAGSEAPLAVSVSSEDPEAWWGAYPPGFAEEVLNSLEGLDLTVN